MPKAYLISDCHLNHSNIKTWCQRPDDFTDRIDRNVLNTLKPGDTLLNLGDFGIGDVEGYVNTAKRWKAYGIKHILVRGNHDQKSPLWYMDNGFDFACDMMVFRGCLLTHKPWMGELPDGVHVNLHGHLHNVWSGFLPTDPEKEQEEFVYAAKNGKLLRDFHRLFAVEYTDYRPVEFDKFVSKPDKYQARRPNKPLVSSVPDATGSDFSGLNEIGGGMVLRECTRED